MLDCSLLIQDDLNQETYDVMDDVQKRYNTKIEMLHPRCQRKLKKWSEQKE